VADTRRGCFLVLDGPEGAGKTTQADRLVRRLRDSGREATGVRDPGSTPVSERIREVLLDRRLPGGIDPDLIWDLGRTACHGIEPDLTVLLDLPVQEGLARARRLAEPDRIEAKDPAYHEKVRQGFLTMAKARPQAFAVVDATQPPDAVADAVWEAAKRVL